MPSEVEEVLANASPEQAGAFGRLREGPGTRRAGTQSNVATAAVTIVSIVVAVADDDATRTNAADGDAETRAAEVQGGIDVGNINVVNVGRDVLDAVDDDPDARAGRVRQLRQTDDPEPDEPATPAEDTGANTCTPPDGDGPPR